MRKLNIKAYDIDGKKTININFLEQRHITITTSVVYPDISIFDLSKDELEYMASELKRIADTMES